MTEKNNQFRNVALASHSGAGKTSLSEIMIFKSGMTNRIGRVEEGNTVMDFEPEELKRQSSFSTSFYQFLWKKNTISLMDTPGDQNFISDTKLCMQAADSSIILVDAVDGVKVQTEVVWEFSKKFGLPSAIFINKLDKDRSNFDNILKDFSSVFSEKLLLLQFPILKDGIIVGIIDLISNNAYIYDDNGKASKSEIPDSLKKDVNIHREFLIETIAETDDILIEKYLDGEELSNVDLQVALKKSVLSRTLIPVLCGSALSNIGVDLLMDFIIDVMPSPSEVEFMEALDLKSNELIQKKACSTEPFSGFVFKTISDPYAGQLSLIRIVSGLLKNDGVFYNSTKQMKEKFNQLLIVLGKDQKSIDLAGPGSIVAIAKLKSTKTGDTICDETEQITFSCAKPLSTLISFAIKAKNKDEEDKVYISLTKLLEDDSSLKLDRNSETKEVLISGLGQIHIESTMEKLKRKFNVEVVLEIPKVPYRETIKKKVRVQGKHKKQSGGHGQFGDCWIILEPLPRGSGFEFVNAIVGGSIPRQYIPAVEKGIVEASKKGILTGFPCVDFRATCDFGSYHAVDSSEMAFKIAGSLAYKKACEQAQPVVLEPIMKVSITAPDEFTGDIMGDLSSKRGRVLGVEIVGNNQTINAEVPLAEIQMYAQDLRSITAGRGFYLMKFCRYDEVPSNLLEKVLEKIKSYSKSDT